MPRIGSAHARDRKLYTIIPLLGTVRAVTQAAEFAASSAVFRLRSKAREVAAGEFEPEAVACGLCSLGPANGESSRLTGALERPVVIATNGNFRSMKKVSLITDGSCLGNPGPGGWACILRFGGVKKEFFGFDPHTTNNRMELMAPIQGLLALKEPCEVEITTDSEYVLNGITKWIVKWKRRQWWRKHEPVRNVDFWMELDELASLNKTTWSWTRGHAGHKDNSLCDWLAQNAATTQRSCWADGRPHAPLRLNLGADYVPPRPQPGLFEDFESNEEE